MNTFFCADSSRQIGEKLIGSATNYDTYILVECPPPWTSEAFDSKWVPSNLKTLVEEVKRAKLAIRFLLIANDQSHKVEQTTLLIYQKQKGLTQGYQKSEFLLENIEQVAGTVKKFLRGRTLDFEQQRSSTRDILICTHGSHDKCCARYGNPFYFSAQSTIANLSLENVRIWRASHIGGHRFAPTMIDLPEGRYYGALEQDSFKAIVTRTGDINCLNQVYRGWGILPTPLQIVEKELILHYGWDWFNYTVAGKILEQSLDNNSVLAELTFAKTTGALYTCQAKLVKDESKTVQLKSSCNAKQNSVFMQYTVASLWLEAEKMVSLSA
ncbi:MULTISPECIES: sucrase ferredoxin [Calothrix]|uniref:Sucrase ferredoxin n=2 Tax=Calothrix TaxID=1186 RepID=A0ABR8AD27_9CYAN|nr:MULTISPECIES: sucrase ferredoxin [Calothrix]MBD2197915.1 sucrase ferredoxin [Calothrix parietina FACHB-288]MBD2226800.1 sucrase ferredoxin [Calothrix anomala FACHB-343]